MKNKFVAYYRISNNKSGGLQSYSIEAQEQSVKHYLASIDCELIASFQEVESGAVNDRPQLMAAIRMAKENKAILVIAKLDRLSRDAEFLLKLQNTKVDFVACDMPTADRFTVGIIALLAQREREMISERTKRGLAIARQRGVKLGNPNPGVAIVAARAVQSANKIQFAKSVMPAIGQIRSAGVNTLSGIADCLTKRGERTPRGGVWTATAVKRAIAACETNK